MADKEKDNGHVLPKVDMRIRRKIDKELAKHARIQREVEEVVEFYRNKTKP